MLIDFHAHVLPGADHGSVSLEMSKRQLEKARKAKVNTIVATPHFYPNRHQIYNFLERRANSWDILRDHLPDGMSVRLGAEVLLCEGLENLPELPQLCIEGTDCILLEMPFTSITDRLINTIYEISETRKLLPIMAHVDRYEPNDVDRVLSLGAIAQINAEALCRLTRRSTYIKWIDRGKIQALGSDIHEDGDNYLKFARAVKVLGHRTQRVMDASSALLNYSIKKINI